MQLLMEADVEGVIGAGRHAGLGERTTYRNGCCCQVAEHCWDPVGLAIVECAWCGAMARPDLPI